MKIETFKQAPSVIVILLTVILPATLVAQDDFYTRPSLFSARPQAVNKFSQFVNRFGPVGIGIELTQPAFGMKVKNVESGSPAALTGQFKAGQIIESINGQELKDIDPRIQLGSIITQAEATDGKVTFILEGSKDGKPQRVTVSIPVLGAYAHNWPLDCKKSDAIVRNLAAKFKAAGHKGDIGLNGPRMLFLLSTGEEEDLDVVRDWVKEIVEKNQNYGQGLVYQWHVSWGAPPLAEYYLRTGDPSVLPLLKQIADAVKTTQYDDGWAGRGGKGGGHHMGLAGTGTLTFLLLAKQCGVDVDNDMLQRAVMHYYRFAGKGTNPYMDAPPEGTYTDNGRNGRLAFAMAAASRLRPEGEASLYAKARDNCAMKSFYSSSYMLHGHTGGGIGEVWRSAAMGLMAEKRSHHYREFMNQRTWFYDLSRRFTGTFGIVGGGDRYDNESWGAAMGLTYTAPRKKLCIFGAPRSKYSKSNDAIPFRCWGTPASDTFLSLDAPKRADGKRADLDNESIANDTGLPLNRQMSDPEVTDQDILSRIYHPDDRSRAIAAGAIRKYGRFHLIPPLLRDKDPRIRNTGVNACTPELFKDGEDVAGFPRDEMLALINNMLNDESEAWFNHYKLLKLIKKFDADLLAPQKERMIELLAHEEWWIRHAAQTALVPLMLDPGTYGSVLPAIAEHVPNFTRVNWEFYKGLQALPQAEPNVRKAVAEALGVAYSAYPGVKAVNSPGGFDPNAVKASLGSYAHMLGGTSEGLEVLYKVSSQRFPEQALPHSELFLSRPDLWGESKELKEALKIIVREEMIPKHVAANWDSLQNFAAAKDGRLRVADGLNTLYKQIDITDYQWEAFGPKLAEMEWYYHSFTPKEEWSGESDRLGRFRKVTFPKGMDNWSENDFDHVNAGWQRGLAPFGASAGEKGYFFNEGKCGQPFCRCDIPIATLWEQDVILLRGFFKFPAFEEGYNYRLLYAGISHVGSGGGYALYVNGNEFMGDDRGIDRRGGGTPIGRMITKDFWPTFSDKKVCLSAISFMKNHPRTKNMGGNMGFFLQRMKVPPLPSDAFHKTATLTHMTSSRWQTLQAPDKTVVNPLEGKFLWDGKFKTNADLLGDWALVDQVPGVDEFVPGKPRTTKLPARLKRLFLKAKGGTHSVKLLWSGVTLIDVTKKEALAMQVRTIGAQDYLFVEAGGFNQKHPEGWKCPILVLKKQ